MSESVAFDTFIPVLKSSDLSATRDFYVRELGLEVELEQGRNLVLRVAGGHLGFELTDMEEVASRDDVVLTLLTADVDLAYRRLRAVGVATEGPPRRDRQHTIYRFYARDPDGYRLEVGRFTEPPRG